jgi:hypothetical protein
VDAAPLGRGTARKDFAGNLPINSESLNSLEQLRIFRDEDKLNISKNIIIKKGTLPSPMARPRKKVAGVIFMWDCCLGWMDAMPFSSSFSSCGNNHFKFRHSATKEVKHYSNHIQHKV